MKEAEMDQVAEWIDAAISANGNEAKLTGIHADIKEFVKAFPLPSEV